MKRLLAVATMSSVMLALPGAAVTAAGSFKNSSTTAQSQSSTGSHTVWLCRPGLANDPCTANLNATVVHPNGGRSYQAASVTSHPAIDCFYVYPTVSSQPTVNANLNIDPEEISVAKAQASRFSQACHVYAPMYRQLTLGAISGRGPVTRQNLLTAFASLVSAWHDYLAHYNHGHGVVLIGHSQGAGMLISLIKSQIDNDPSVRRRLVSAILLGGNVTVPVGKSVGGDFQHVPACRAASQTGCAIAYSSFDTTPPANTFFGKVGLGVSALSGQKQNSQLQVLCTNPASLQGGTGNLSPYFPSAGTGQGVAGAFSSGSQSVHTSWVTYPGLYAAHCMYANGISWLQVDDVGSSGDHRPIVHEVLGPNWGLHLVDVNIALGNLVDTVRQEAAAFHH